MLTYFVKLFLAVRMSAVSPIYRILYTERMAALLFAIVSITDGAYDALSINVEQVDMGKSSAGKDIASKAASMTLEELNAEIHRMLNGWQHGGTSQGRRAFFKSLIALEAQRESRFDIPAPKRRYNR